MKYISTRDLDQKELSFTDVLLTGLAPDGGLYVPKYYPQIDDQLESLRNLSYSELAFSILQLFTGDSIPLPDLEQMVSSIYNKEVFKSSDVTPVTKLYDSIYIQDLSSGPSLAFKDLAMQFLGQVMNYELDRQGRVLTILGASSGDTVSAAEEAMRGKSRIKVVMLTPKYGMSDFQKAQAGSIMDDNIYNVSIEGPFDHCQDIVKEINREASFKSSFHIGAVNSINWGRISAQIVYYFKGYFATTHTNQDVIDVVVPSGNFGNVLAAYIAKKMGLPIRRLLVATNENVVLDEFFKTGIYEQLKVQVTSSPSMDISKASNIERFFFDLVDRDPQALANLMTTFEQTQRIDLSDHLDTIHNGHQFFSGDSNHSDRLKMIQKVFEKSQRVIDPHTAAAVKVAEAYRQDDVPLICMETAKPTKFESTVQEALGSLPDRPDEFVGLEDKPQRFFDVDATSEAVKEFIQSNIHW